MLAFEAHVEQHGAIFDHLLGLVESHIVQHRCLQQLLEIRFREPHQQAVGFHGDGGVAFRGAFIIDKEGNVRSQTVNDLPLGRNFDEFIRVIEALQFHEEHGEVCPAGWNKGDKGMTASPDGVAAYLSENADNL